MCYQLVELYSQCKCLYYQFPVDRCASYGRPGHSIMQRQVFVGYCCSEHSTVSREKTSVPSHHTQSDSDVDSSDQGPEHDRKSETPSLAQLSRWHVVAWQILQAPELLVIRSPRLLFQPFNFESWVQYLASFQPTELCVVTPSVQVRCLSVSQDVSPTVSDPEGRAYSRAVRSGIANDRCLRVASLLPSRPKQRNGAKIETYPNLDRFFSVEPPPEVKLEPADDTVNPYFQVGSGHSAATKSSFVITPPAGSLFSEPNGSSTDLSERSSWPATDPLDSDDQTSSSQSESSDALEENHDFNEVKEEILKAILSSYFAHQHGSQPSQRSGGTASSPSSSGGGDSSTQPARKRNRSNADIDDTSRPRAPWTYKEQKASTDHDLLFACPFFKREPLRYHSCQKAAQKRIRDVKQHLRRKHFDPFYCSRCWSIFQSEQGRDEHARAQNCEIQPGETREQLSLSQIMALNKKVNHKLTPSMQWFSVWDICFPGLPHPRSPYVDPELSEQLSSFHEYYVEQGPEIISNALWERNLLDWNSPNEEHDLAAFRRAILSEALDRIYESWLDSRRSSPPRAVIASTSDSASGSDNVSGVVNGSPTSVAYSGRAGPPNPDSGDGFSAMATTTAPDPFQAQLESDRGPSQVDDFQDPAPEIEYTLDWPADLFTFSDAQLDFGSMPNNLGYDS